LFQERRGRKGGGGKRRDVKEKEVSRERGGEGKPRKVLEERKE